MPQYPPSVDQPPPGMIGAPLQQAQLQGTRPPSAAAQQMLPQQQMRPNAFPGSLSDLVTSFETVKQKGTRSFVTCEVVVIDEYSV